MGIVIREAAVWNKRHAQVKPKLYSNTQLDRKNVKADYTEGSRRQLTNMTRNKMMLEIQKRCKVDLKLSTRLRAIYFYLVPSFQPIRWCYQRSDKQCLFSHFYLHKRLDLSDWIFTAGQGQISAPLDILVGNHSWGRYHPLLMLSTRRYYISRTRDIKTLVAWCFWGSCT